MLTTIIDKIRWLIFRWSRMKHPSEDLYRISQFLQVHLKDRFDIKRRSKPFFFVNNNLLNRDYLETYSTRLAKFYSVLQTKISISYTQWRTEPKSKIKTPLVFKGKINHKSYKSAGEVKYLYELNRLHVLPVIAYSYSKNLNWQSFKQLNELVDSWMQENPYNHSVNWKNGIEVSIRSLNLLLTRILLTDIFSTTELCKKIDFSVTLHYEFLKNHLSLYSSANNHLLKELCGLIITGCAYDFRQKNEELKYYFKYYQDEVLKQTFEDGGSKEQSVHYHAAVLNASFLVLHFVFKNQLKANNDFLYRIKSMCIFLDYMTLGGQKESLFGDKDDSNILYDVFDKGFNLYHSLLETGKRIFTDIKYEFYQTDKEHRDFINALFYEGLYYESHSMPATYRQNNGYTYFSSSGYFIFKSNNLKSHLYFDVGEMGFGSLAAHGHSDILHFTLWVNGEPIIVDPGTYQYHSKYLKWRNYFKGITAHNTISVNGQDHSKPLGTMMWSKLPAVQILSFGEKNNVISCEAEHSAFSNSKGKIKHKRKISTTDRGYCIDDEVSGKENFEVDFYLHFHPTINASLNKNLLTIKKGRILIKIESEIFKNAKLYHGDENIPLGWYSLSYDNKVPTTTLKASCSIFENNNILTTIVIEEL
jgi:hypothetical protein